MIKKSITIHLSEAMDARPIALLVQEANQYSSTVYIEKEEKHINAKSIMGMMSLQLSTGDSLVVAAEGNDEEKAVEKMKDLLMLGE